MSNLLVPRSRVSTQLMFSRAVSTLIGGPTCEHKGSRVFAAYLSRRVSDDRCAFRDITADERTGADDGTIANDHAAENNSAAADPDVSTDLHWAVNFQTTPSESGVPVMISAIDVDT